MENSEKMIMIPFNDFRIVLEKSLKLAKKSAFNDKLEIFVNGKFIEGTNVIDYLLEVENLKFVKEFENYLSDKYTKISPIDMKLRNNKNYKSWIKLD